MSIPPLFCPLAGAFVPTSMVSYIFYKRKEYGSSFKSKKWIVFDACGMFTAFLTNFLIFGAVFVNTFYIVSPFLDSFLGWLNLCISNSLLLLAAFCQWQTMLTNPCAVPASATPLEISLEQSRQQGMKIRRCRRCGVFKPSRAHHDGVSGRCVVKMDHYCPWVNNVIGFSNHKFFVLFLSYTFLGSVHVLCLIIWHHSHCLFNCSGITPPVYLLIYLVAFEALVFGIFTACMFCEQFYGIVTGKTQIDRLQELSNGKNHTYRDAFIDVFGNDPMLRWIIPTHPRWKQLEERIGYRSERNFMRRDGFVEKAEMDSTENIEKTKLIDRSHIV